jgi:hypothetical protein
MKILDNFFFKRPVVNKQKRRKSLCCAMLCVFLAISQSWVVLFALKQSDGTNKFSLLNEHENI